MSSTPARPTPNGYPRFSHGPPASARRGASMTRDAAAASSLGVASAAADDDEREDHVQQLLRQRWAQTEASIATLFGTDGQARRLARSSAEPEGNRHVAADAGAGSHAKTPPQVFKKAARTIDDDYGDDEEDEEDEAADKESPLKAKGTAGLLNGFMSHTIRPLAPENKLSTVRTNTSTASEQAKSSEDLRKQLEEDKKAAADAAKRNFQNMFHTFEYDRDAMLEQQKLDELDREVENEISGDHGAMSTSQPTAGGGTTAAATTQGSLGNADLGASSLTLKHLIARIDAKRDMVRASDNQLRTLISDVRKGRSKWASEDRVGQEELYEAAEKVLLELKSHNPQVLPFMNRVNKREAQDYYTIIKHPMDFGAMFKKLKQFTYKSKKDFVDDLNLIWANALKYNQHEANDVRKKALYMRKETDKLIPLIPDIVIRARAEVEAEERRQQSLDADESDDDDAPIMASRGRKAPKKGNKSGPSSARKGPPINVDDASTPVPEGKPALHAMASSLRNEFLRGDSEMHDLGSNGFSTPPPGTATPLVNGVHGSGAPPSQADVMEIDGLGHSAASLAQEDVDEESTEFKTWKQVTMRDRATATAERNRLFRGEHLNGDEPALLRSKAMMRRWVRQQKISADAKSATDPDAQDGDESTEMPARAETLAEGIETEEDSTLPDYYNPLSTIPDLTPRWRWMTDSEGHAVPQSEDWMRMFPREQYKSTHGSLTKRMEANMRQMQDTRKICSKIGVVKQMQLQGQTYQNQFQKYETQPFVEQDVGAVVVSDIGPLMAPWVNRAALQRSVGKIFYHAGFEDFQPSALDTVTDLANEFFVKLVEGLRCFREQPLLKGQKARFTFEEQVLHSLHENGQDVEMLETYVKDEVDRLGTKLGVVHERMKSHLADLLRPALSEYAGADGAGAFHDDSEQFVGGDFADEMGVDYFALGELGLVEEFGLESLSVPFHLLQNRMHSAYQAQNQGPAINTGLTFPPPAPYEAVTLDTVDRQIGLVRDFFRDKLRKNHDEPLVEDEDLPQKQRFPKPRLPPTGKILSPRKRPIREQQQAAKKRRKLEEQASGGGGEAKAIKPLKLRMPDPPLLNDEDPEKDGGELKGAMISPESITAAA